MSGSASITIMVTDDNDNSPVFIGQQFIAHLAENATTGTPVIDTLATDLDTGTNGQIT